MKINILALFFFTAVEGFGHPGHQHIGGVDAGSFSGVIVDSGVVLKVSIPYEHYLRDERVWITYGLSNNTDSDLVLSDTAVGNDNSGKILHYFPYTQLSYQFRNNEQTIQYREPEYGDDWAELSKSEYVYTKVKPGDSTAISSRYISWGYNQQFDNYDEFRLLLKIGEREYVASNWNKLNILKSRLMDEAQFVDVNYTFSDTPKQYSNIKLETYIQLVAGKRWIFIGRYRVAMIPEGFEPVFDFNKETSVLTISFPKSNYSSIVYDVRNIQTLSGPRELVPNLYALDDMKASLENERIGPDGSKIDSSNSSQFGIDAHHGALEVKAPVFVSLFSVLLFFVALLAVILIRKSRRQ